MSCKKIISVILCLAMLFCFGACQKQSHKETSPSWMPYGLQFGMTYDEFKQQLSSCGVDAPSLKPADANASYVLERAIFPVSQDSSVWDFLGSATMKKLADEELELSISDDLWEADFAYTVSMPAFYFSFNQNKQLYEFCCIWGCMTDDLPSAVMPEIINNYNTKLGLDGKVSTYFGEWNTNAHRVSIEYSANDEMMILVHHCIEYNLDS